MEPVLKRVYNEPGRDDGLRVLVDRLWPRGLSRERAQVDVWLKDIAPSDRLRRWFGHQAGKWPQFQARYRQELAGNPALAELRTLLRDNDRVTLLHAARDTARNNAVVLAAVLRGEEKD